MIDELQSCEISPSEWISINQFIQEIKKINFPCITVYYPFGKDKETILLMNETKRDENLERIESAIEEKITSVKADPSSVGKFVKTVCIFGWIEKNKVKINHIGISKPLPYIYMAGKKPYVKPFQDILKTNYDVLLVIINQKSAKIQRFDGNQIMEESTLSIDLQGRHRKGGQSQGRFLRARQTKIHVFFKKVAKKIKEMGESSEIILLGGNGQAKTEFFDHLYSELAKKCRFVENISFSSSQKEISKKLIHHLYMHRKKHVTGVIEKYERMVKEGLTENRNDKICKALKAGAVDILIVSAEYHKDLQFKKILNMLEIAKKYRTKIEFAMSPNIIKKLEIHNSVLAILRFRMM